MIFMHDTRDKIGKHKNVDKYLTDNGHTVIRSKMYVGDITLLHDQSVCIDLKQNVLEVYGNLYPDKKRFVAELEKARAADISLIILIEDDEVGSMQELIRWKNPQPNRTAMTPNGDRIYKVISVLSKKYGAEFRFCRKQDTGAEVVRILTEGA